MPMDVVDTHAHIYSPDEQTYPPIEDPHRPPGGKGSLEDLRAETEANGVDAACIIQTSSFYRFDNRYICDSALGAPKWTAGVVTLDPDDPTSARQLRELAREHGIKGMRSNPDGSGAIDSPGVRALWKTAADEGIVVNMHIRRDNAEAASRMLGDFRTLPVVLDHTLYPKVGPDLDDTLRAVRKLAERSNLNAKLTFVATGSHGGYPCEDMHAPCLAVIDAFGAQRCMWGSDFPCELWTPKVSYAEALKIFREVLALSSRDRAMILGGTASRLWFDD